MKFPLGKGLQSLIPNRSAQEMREESGSLKRETVFDIETAKIKPNPSQPRLEIEPTGLKELASSIKEHGILQPLIVTKLIKETPRGEEAEYCLIAGHRRLAAAKLLNLPHVPAIVRMTNKQSNLELALVENIQREDLNAVEKARAFQRLYAEFDLTHQEIAQKVGKSREAVANTIRLLNLPNEIQQAVLANQISEGHARALISLKDAKSQQSLFREIVGGKLSVRQAEEKRKQLVINEKTGSATATDPELQKIAEMIQKNIGFKVSVAKSGMGGRIAIKFNNKKELEELLKRLAR